MGLAMMYGHSFDIPTDVDPVLLDAIKDLPLKEQALEVIKTIYDPEIPVNIWELGLIYKLEVDDAGKISVDMTLTAPACPVAGTMPEAIKTKLMQIPTAKEVAVELVWEPQWNRDMMSEAAKVELGFF